MGQVNISRELKEQAIFHLEALLADHSLLGYLGICHYLRIRLGTYRFGSYIISIMKEQMGLTYYAGKCGKMTPERIELTHLVINSLRKELGEPDGNKQ